MERRNRTSPCRLSGGGAIREADDGILEDPEADDPVVEPGLDEGANLGRFPSKAFRKPLPSSFCFCTRF
eukprot:8152819-Alexandrium_andersonii.AAC.1